MLGRVSWDELDDLVRRQSAALEVQSQVIVGLSARVAELEARLAGSSLNSSRSPSSDGPVKPVRQRSLRKASGKKPGGQGGHEGVTRMQVVAPDEVVEHRPASCRSCGAGLEGVERVGVVCRQVVEIPPIQAHVTEHRLVKVACSCGTITTGSSPVGVNAPVVFGPRFAAVATYLYQGQFCSKARTAAACRDLFGITVSTGTVETIASTMAARLDPFLDWAKAELAAGEVLHADETGIRVSGANQWVHAACTKNVVVFNVSAKRGFGAIKSAGVLGNFTGTLVRDAYAPYDKFDQIQAHQLCGAHLLRELQAVADFHATHPEYVTHPGWCWATQATDALMAIKKAADKEGICSSDVLEANQRLLASAALIGATDTGPPGKVGQKHRALARRITRRAEDYLRFATTPGVPFTNNQIERDIRPIKTRMKISGALRSPAGAATFAALRSYLATCAKNTINTIDALTTAWNATPWPTT